MNDFLRKKGQVQRTNHGWWHTIFQAHLDLWSVAAWILWKLKTGGYMPLAKAKEEIGNFLCKTAMTLQKNNRRRHKKHHSKMLVGRPRTKTIPVCSRDEVSHRLIQLLQLVPLIQRPGVPQSRLIQLIQLLALILWFCRVWEDRE